MTKDSFFRLPVCLRFRFSFCRDAAQPLGHHGQLLICGFQALHQGIQEALVE